MQNEIHAVIQCVIHVSSFTMFSIMCDVHCTLQPIMPSQMSFVCMDAKYVDLHVISMWLVHVLHMF